MSNLSEDIVKSERDIDYTSLQELLEKGTWIDVDEETYKLMLKAVGRETKGFLDLSDIDNFPCKVLLTIDKLWYEHSNGRCGFRVQRDIWERLGRTIDNDDDNKWITFQNEVGWPRNSYWTIKQSYDKVCFPLGKWAGIKIVDTLLSDESPDESIVDSRFINRLASKLARCN
jgi:hypothetical protein